MASGTLYTYPDNFRAYKVLVAAQYSGANVTVASQAPAFNFGETNKSADFLSKFPLGKVPAFESASGDCLFESNAIAHYVANDQLRGTTQQDSAFVQQWINFSDNEILPAMCTWVYPCLGIIQYNKQETEKSKDQIRKVLTLLNDHLKTRTFLVGERISQADISTACNLLLLYQYVLDPEFRKSYQNVNRWFTTLIYQPQFKDVIGDFKCCEKMSQFDAKKYAELHGQQKKEKAPKATKAPKQEKKAPSPEEDDEDEDPEEKPKETKDPFAALPKGTFNVDEFKRTYSNHDTETVALPYFWEHIDTENFSLWKCEYNYPDELSKIFMTANLIGGMLQRLDKLRKHAFGSMCIFGEDDNNSISGLWYWRGQELAFTMSPDLQIDYESYTWTKLDPTTEETKLMVKEYFCWEGNFDGKKFSQGKIFK